MAVQYTEETLSRVQTWLSHSDAKRRIRENLAELHSLYATITGQPINSCVSCGFANYVAILQAYERQSLRLLHPETVANSSYSLAQSFENEVFVHESYSKAVSAENLTDADAEFFIGKGFRHAFLKNGKPLTEEPAQEAKPKLLKADHQARYKELFGQEPDEKLTVAELIEANDAKQAELDKQD